MADFWSEIAVDASVTEDRPKRQRNDDLDSLDGLIESDDSPEAKRIRPERPERPERNVLLSLLGEQRICIPDVLQEAYGQFAAFLDRLMNQCKLNSDLLSMDELRRVLFLVKTFGLLAVASHIALATKRVLQVPLSMFGDDPPFEVFRFMNLHLVVFDWILYHTMHGMKNFIEKYKDELVYLYCILDSV